MIIFTIVSFEILVRQHPIYQKFGWISKVPLFERVEKIKNSNSSITNNFVIGDSMVEYKMNTKENFLELTKEKISLEGRNENFFNFGFAGTGPRHYLMILNYLTKNDINIDKVYIFIDNCTDFTDYFFDIVSSKPYTIDWKLPTDQNLDIENINFKNFIKKSVSLNIIYRYLFKQYFKIDYGKSYETNLNFLKQTLNVDDDMVLSRLKSVDDNLIHLSKSDIINSYWAASGVVFPKVKKYEKYGYPVHSEKINDLMLSDFKAIENICAKNEIDCSIIFIPDQATIDQSYQNFYINLGYEIDKNFLDGNNYYENLLINNFTDSNLTFYRIHDHLKFKKDMYLPMDSHLNYYGNDVLSDIFVNIILE